MPRSPRPRPSRPARRTASSAGTAGSASARSRSRRHRPLPGPWPRGSGRQTGLRPRSAGGRRAWSPRSRSTCSTRSADVVSGWPAVPPRAGAVRLPARNRAASTDPIMARCDLIASLLELGQPPRTPRGWIPEDSTQRRMPGDSNSPGGLPVRAGPSGLARPGCPVRVDPSGLTRPHARPPRCHLLHAPSCQTIAASTWRLATKTWAMRFASRQVTGGPTRSAVLGRPHMRAGPLSPFLQITALVAPGENHATQCCRRHLR